MPDTLCFECDEMADAWRRLVEPLHPEARVTTLSALAPDAESRAEREKRLAEWLPNGQAGDARAALGAIETLRQALVLTSDDARYCFGQLPSTASTRRLRDLALRYLESPLAADRTARAWAIAEALRSHALDPVLGPDVTFVPAFRPTALFAELARAYGYAAGGPVRVSEPWEALGPRRGRASLLVEGSPGRSATAAAESVLRAIRRGAPAARCAVAAVTGPGNLKLLGWRLSAGGVRLVPPAATSPVRPPEHSVAAAVARLRRSRSEPLGLRLALAARLSRWADEEGSEAGEALRLDRLTESGWLSEPEAKKIASLLATETEGEASAPAARPAVRLSPAFPLPPSGLGSRPVVLLDRAWAQFSDDAWLEPEDAMRLRAAGFNVPAPDSCLERRRRYEAAWLSGEAEPARLFTPAGLLEGASRRAVLRPTPAASPGAPAPVRAAAPRRLSATQLEAYAQCPSRYFFANRLRLRPRETSWEERFSLWLGIATHRCLEQWWGARSGPLPDDPAALAAEALPFFHAALEEEKSLPREASARAALEHAFLQFLARVPAIERALTAGFGPRATVARELPFTLSVGCEITGSIDRVDRVDGAHGGHVVLDYKTGNVAFTPAHVAEGRHFQALLYWLGAEATVGPVAGVVFYDLKEGEARRGIVRSERAASMKAFTRGHVMAGEAIEALKEDGLARVREIGSRIAVGDFGPTPSAEACEPCEMGPLCRRRHGS